MQISTGDNTYIVSSKQLVILEAFAINGRVIDSHINNQLSDDSRVPLSKSDASYAILNHAVNATALHVVHNGVKTVGKCKENADGNGFSCEAEAEEGVAIKIEAYVKNSADPKLIMSDRDAIVFAISNFNNYVTLSQYGQARERPKDERTYALFSADAQSGNVMLPSWLRFSYPYYMTLNGIPSVDSQLNIQSVNHTVTSQKPIIFALNILLQLPLGGLPMKYKHIGNKLHSLQLIEGLPGFIYQDRWNKYKFRTGGAIDGENFPKEPVLDSFEYRTIHRVELNIEPLIDNNGF